MVTLAERRFSVEALDEKGLKAVILVSGGIDSSTLLYQMASGGYDCYPLLVLYGQRHSKEVLAAGEICRGIGLVRGRWKVVDLESLGRILPSTLTGEGEIPEGHYAAEIMKQTVVPNRNMILLAVAAGYAEGLGAGFVAYAAHAGDHYIYPDCRPEFVEAVRSAIQLATETRVQLLTPFLYWYKKDIVSWGKELGVPWKLTWSCYKGGEKHCGKCGTCIERKEAFILAGVDDPTEYVE
jgi:7-cyano-7-deazaguanine synthase